MHHTSIRSCRSFSSFSRFNRSLNSLSLITHCAASLAAASGRDLFFNKSTHIQISAPIQANTTRKQPLTALQRSNREFTVRNGLCERLGQSRQRCGIQRRIRASLARWRGERRIHRRSLFLAVLRRRRRHRGAARRRAQRLTGQPRDLHVGVECQRGVGTLQRGRCREQVFRGREEVAEQRLALPLARVLELDPHIHSPWARKCRVETLEVVCCSGGR